VRFGIFYEHQLPRPWADGDEERLYGEALEQVALADRLGVDYAWAVEHHFLEEYSHCSAPEVFLAAVSQRTRRIRLGHGIRLMPPAYNHPVRVAEALATLDLVSGGRVDWGIGESSSAVELEGFGVSVREKEAMCEEAAREVARMLSTMPYPGHEGRWFRVPPRNVVPKPVQRPHPPMWMACSNRTSILRAARHGIGALTFSFVTPEEARTWVDDYYRVFREECVPLGRAVNPNIAMVTAFGCDRDPEQARRRFSHGFDFFGFALAYYYGFGSHVPGRTSVWDEFEGRAPDRGLGDATPYDDPDGLRNRYRQFEEAGVDQVIVMPQAGRNRHDHICEALELFGREVLPEFAGRDEQRQKVKRERLAPHVEAAMGRASEAVDVDRGEIPAVDAFGLRSERTRHEVAAVLYEDT